MTLIEEVGECIMYWIGEWWQKRKDLLYAELIDGFCLSPLHEQMDTTHHYYYHISLTDLFVY